MIYERCPSCQGLAVTYVGRYNDYGFYACSSGHLWRESASKPQSGNGLFRADEFLMVVPSPSQIRRWQQW